MQDELRYPLGIQTFSEIINGGYLYIDKTAYVYHMTQKKKYVFLSRPRRFGKSLLVSTLHSYFEGRKELFKGLALEKLETEWVKYPVIRIDLSGGKHLGKEPLERYLIHELDNISQRLGVEVKSDDVNVFFMDLITMTHKKYQKPVVLLIDEYDAPLLDVVHEEDNLKELRQVMRNFYSPIKKCDQYLKFVFITGITKFSQLSIFSELNNLKNISMLPEFAGVCGITEQEMLQQMADGIDALAQKNNWTKQEAVSALKAHYDGYHFSWPSPDVYNPYSLLNAMDDAQIKAYWFSSGTPSFLIAMFNKFGVTPSELGKTMMAVEEDFDSPTEKMTDITPLLYQSGYLTIKDYDPNTMIYSLDIPNQEIHVGLFRSLLPNYVGSLKRVANVTAAQMQVALAKDDIETMLKLLQQFLEIVPGVNHVNKPENFESHWQQMLFVIFSLLGAKADVEIHTPTGRVDMAAKTARTLYLFEFKLNQTAEAAMKQIELKDYAKRFSLCGLPIVKVGINFDSQKRTISDWTIKSMA